MSTARSRSLALLLAAAALLAVGLAGCSSDDKGTGSANTTTTKLDTGSGDEDAEANTLALDMQDYSFGVTGELKPGTTTLAMKNSGTEMHMAAFFRLKQGKTLADLQAALGSEDENAMSGVTDGEVDSPGGLLSPGQAQEVTTDFLGAGTYAVVCFLPTAGEQTAVPHFAKGMINSFQVGGAPTEATAPKADATYTIDDGRIDGPKTLKAGENILKMTSSGKGPHEFVVVKKRTPETTYDDIDKFFTGLFESQTPPPKGYLDNAPGVVVADTFDVATGNTVSVAADLQPGSYLIGCAREPDEDEGDAKPHTGELLDVTVT